MRNSDSGQKSAPEGTLDARVEAVARECQALKGSMARGRSIRMLLGLATLVFLVGFGWAYFKKGQEIRSQENVDRLVALAQSRLEDKSAEYMGEVERLVSTASPALTDAFYQRAKQDLPHYLAALGEERDALIERIQANVEQKLREKQGQVLARYKNLLQEEFPDLTEEQYGRMINNLDEAVQRLARRYYREQLQAELNKLYDSWDQFPRAEADPNVRLEEQFIAALVDLLQHKLTELDQPGVSTASQ